MKFIWNAKAFIRKNTFEILNMSSAKWWPFCIGLNVLIFWESHNLLPVVRVSDKHLMMTSSNEKGFRVAGHLWGEPSVNGGFLSQRPVTQSFDIFFHLRLSKLLSKQPRRGWFETQSCSLWRLCNVLARCLLWIIIASAWRVKSRHLGRSFNNLLRVTSKKTLNVLIAAPLRNPPVTDTWIPYTNGQQLCVWFDYVLHVEMIWNY